MFWKVLLGLFLGCALVLAAQEPYRFESRVYMVSVPVAVTDKEGNFVRDLETSDFKLYEDGMEQEVTLFARGLNESWVGMDPVLKEAASGKQVMGLILDASGSMEDQMGLLHSAALKFLDNIPKTEHLVLLDFDENMRISEYSSDDQRQIAERIYDVEAEGWTALYDAVATVLERVYYDDGRKTRRGLQRRCGFEKHTEYGGKLRHREKLRRDYPFDSVRRRRRPESLSTEL